MANNQPPNYDDLVLALHAIDRAEKFFPTAFRPCDVRAAINNARAHGFSPLEFTGLFETLLGMQLITVEQGPAGDGLSTDYVKLTAGGIKLLEMAP